MSSSLLIVDAKMNAALFITEYNGGEAGGRAHLSTQLGDISWIPTFALRVARLLDSVTGIQGIQANLFSLIVGNGSQRGGDNGLVFEKTVGPHVIYVRGLINGAIYSLEVDSH